MIASSYVCQFSFFLFFSFRLKLLGFAELRQKYQMEVQNLTLTTQPFKTLQFFAFALVAYVKQLLLYVFRKGGFLVLFTVFLGAFGLLLAVDGSQEVSSFLSGFTTIAILF